MLEPLAPDKLRPAQEGSEPVYHGGMNRLQGELQRLYLPQDAPDGHVRAMVLELARPASWDLLAKVWQGVQADLDLPAPGIAISGVDGYQLWFSLSQAVPAARAMAFVEALRRRHLGDVAQERIAIRPADAALPPLQAQSGRWSAFVTADLAALFADEPWLDLPPSPDAQADLLSRLDSMKPGALDAALQRLAPLDAAPLGPRPFETSAAPAAGSLDPRSFLLDVMNDRAIEMHLRIEAAKALLPYLEGRRPE